MTGVTSEVLKVKIHPKNSYNLSFPGNLCLPFIDQSQSGK